MEPSAMELEDIEIQLLLEGLFRHYGFDFREYAPASLKRRILGHVGAEELGTVSALQERLLHDPASMGRFLLTLSVNVSGMFRDPQFFLAFRRRVVPLLRTYPFIRIWQPACSTGEEVYSMAILLREEGLYERTRIYATDMNEALLGQAKEGVFSLAPMQRYAAQYVQAGGKGRLADYFTPIRDRAVFSPSLRQNVVFGQHNLATDRSFNEFHAILCRNATLYFSQALQERVHALLYGSLCKFGVLGLGAKESLRFTQRADCYDELDTEGRLFRRVR